MKKVKTITVNVIDHNWCPLTIQDGKETTHTGGGDIFHSVIDIIAHTTNDKNVLDKFCRLQDDDRLRVATILILAYLDVQKKINEIWQDYTGEEITGEFKSKEDIDKFFLEKYNV